MTTYPSLTLCPQCRRLRNPKDPCPYCHARRRLWRGILFAAGVLALIILALLLSSCAGGDGSAGVQPPTRRTLSEIRAEALGQRQDAPTPPSAAAIPTQVIPSALPPDEVSWAAWALRLGYRWCAVIDGAPMLMGAPDGPRPIEPALKGICRD